LTPLPPSITSLGFSNGLTGGGYPLTIYGANFTSGVTVTFGGNQAVITSISSTDISVTVPPGIGAVTVLVTLDGVTSNGVIYTYLEPTSTVTSTNTLTATTTNTPTFTLTPTPTLTPTITNTPTFTVTTTSTLSLASLGQLVLYPNPSDGTVPVKINVPLTTTENVKIKIYTTAFRKVQDLDFTAVGPGDVQLTIPLTDKWGTRLANGLYYVEALTDKGLLRTKWLLLR
jgi:hypothetical protein